MNSRNHKARRQATTRRLRSSLLSAASVTGFALMMFCGNASLAKAQQPFKDAIFEPANRVARFLGIGYSDGYHASQSRSNCALLDLPPASVYRTQAAQQSHAHGQALFSMPASAYTFGAPAWTGSAGHHHVYTAAPQVYPQPVPNTDYHSTNQLTFPAPTAGSVHSYPVQPLIPPSTSSAHSTPAYPPNPNYSPSLQPASPQTTPPSQTTQPKRLDSPSPRNQGKLEFEDLPAPQATPAQVPPSETSPSDLPSDPPSGKFLQEDHTQQLLQGLESLGEQSLEDPLMQDDQRSTNLSVSPEESLLSEEDPESLLQESTNDPAIPGSLNDSSDDLDLDLDLEGLSLPPATGDADALLNTQMRINPYDPNSSYRNAPAPSNHWPQQAQHPRLSAPVQQSQRPQRLTEPTSIPSVIGTMSAVPEIVKPAVTRLPSDNTTRTPRTARTIYEPRR